MTGEITLRGRVLPIGGLKEKILAAHRAGVTIVLMPKKNEMDLLELPARVRRDLQLVLVSDMRAVLEHALLPAQAESGPQPGRRRASKEKKVALSRIRRGRYDEHAARQVDTKKQDAALGSRVVDNGHSIVRLWLEECHSDRRRDPAQYLPSDWTAMESHRGFQEINIDEAGPNKEADEDGESEWLYFFHYDNPPGATNGPIGGIIYDAQQGTEIYNPDVTIPFPFQPSAFFVPYRLLPDWVEGKGQGYLGDTDVTLEQTTLLGKGGKSDELLFLGDGPGGGVTRITIFRWLGKTKGYGVSYFQGSYSAAIVGERVVGNAVQQVQTLNALNDRSVLCEKTVWTRQGDTAILRPARRPLSSVWAPHLHSPCTPRPS